MALYGPWIYFWGIMCVMFCGVFASEYSRDVAKSKCERKVENETTVNKCRECIEGYRLPENPSKNEIRRMIRKCVPKKNPKEWLKGKCEDMTEKQEEVLACYECVDKYDLQKNVTRDDVKMMKKSCLPKQNPKFKAKKKCYKVYETKLDIEECQNCINGYQLSEKATCEEVKEMKDSCLSKRSGKTLWTEPIVLDEYDGDNE